MKALNTNNYLEFNDSCSTDIPCKKHSSSSSVGICAYCLKDRLVNLVCSECGEQRLSSCSCSDDSLSYRYSSCTGEVGSVGRISFLIENEKERTKEGERSDEVILLKRSSSSCVEIKKSKNGFWKIKKLFFRTKKEKGSEKYGKFDEKFDKRGVSRSRSLCNFSGCGDEGSDYAFQSAKISDVTGGIMFSESESRKSGYRGFSDMDSKPRNSGSRYLFDSENEQWRTGFRGLSDSDNEPRKSGFGGLLDAENEPRKSAFRGLYDSVENGFNSFKAVRKMSGPGELNRVNSVPNEFSATDNDDPSFIDFEIHQLLSSESTNSFSFVASCDHKDGNLRKEFSESNRNFSSCSVGGSCRRIWNDKELKNGGRVSNKKGWKWIFFRQSSGRRSTSK